MELEKRFELAQVKSLTERFSISRFLTEIHVDRLLSIRYALQDRDLIEELFRQFNTAYTFVSNWFGIEEYLPVEIWLAPTIEELQYMVCIECSENSFFAPGWFDKKAIIICQSSNTSVVNREEARFVRLLIHEITHHVIRKISGASDFTMKRKQNGELPMWIEEGVCLLLETEYNQDYRELYGNKVREIENWYPLDDLYNDLSACHDISTAYYQSYKEVAHMIEKIGKTAFLQFIKDYQQTVCA